MKKIVTALMVILPLLFLIALFAITSVASVSADIPVNGIVINNKGEDGVFSFDIANHVPISEEDLDIEVLPHKAKNRNYSLTVTDVDSGELTEIVTINETEDGKRIFSLNDVGRAKLTYTSEDGGYSDSVIFNIDSSGILSYEPVLKSASGKEYTLTPVMGNDKEFDYEIDGLEVGDYVLQGEFYPKTATNVQPKYEAANENLLTVNAVNGSINAYYAVKTSVTMSVVDAYGNIIQKSISMSFKKPNNVSATINGTPLQEGEGVTTIQAPLNTKRFTIYLDLDNVNSKDDWQISCANFDSDETKIRQMPGMTNAYAIDIVLDEPVTDKDEPFSNVIIKTKDKTYTLKLSFTDYVFSVSSYGNTDGSAEEMVLLEGQSTDLTISCKPSATLKYTWRIDDENIAKIVSRNESICSVKALSSGVTTLYIDWKSAEDENVCGTIEKTLVIAKPYTSLMFNESTTQNLGLGGTLAIASQKYNDKGEIVDAPYSTNVYNVSNKTTECVLAFDDVTIESSDPNIAEVITSDTGIQIIIKGNGNVTITAEWTYAERFNAKSASFTFTAVNGVWVEDYKQLVAAGNAQKQIVLAKDIYLGDDLYDIDENGNRSANYTSDAEIKEKLLSYTTEITTTFDSQYYKNIGEEDKAKVRYCYEFTNNVYGNGHMLNAEYITNNLDITGIPYDYAVFKGPLNFVAAMVGGVEVASVKGQDNISFLIRNKNIELNNVVLAGCDDASLYDEDKIELNLLNYTGTTLEVMNDATITNCRIKNGRTVVRVHGKYGIDLNSNVNAQEEKINVVIDGCRLQTAREFILKVGTNRVVKNTAATLGSEPSLFDRNGKEYLGYNSSACDNYKNNSEFVEDYVLTDVRLINSTLSSSGLFTIGMESHFSGPMLDGSISLPGWNNLAGTSYPAMLHLEGEVVLDDWKDVANVDSSTLIETNAGNEAKYSFLSLNVGEMLKEVKNVSEKSEDENAKKYKNIIYELNGTQYVHGGIALYGGGKNYSIVDMDKWNYRNDAHQYNVNISILKGSDDEVLSQQGSMLPLAAGSQSFRFIMFDATSTYKPSK